MRVPKILSAVFISLIITNIMDLPPAAYAAAGPDVAALGAVIMESSTGRVLWEKDSRKQLPMASTTKIMTAILAIENCDLSDVVTVSANAASAPQVKMYLTKGEKIPLLDLLYALMLQSSNDAAVAIAEHIAGNVSEFCRLMTLKAREIGAFDTSFETPNGLDAENHYTTAYDLALITRYALKNETFVNIINAPSYTAKSDRSEYEITNKNRFLSEYEGALGVKTGFTGGAGNCFVGAAERGGMRIITVALGSGWGAAGKERKWTDTKNMMNYAFDNYKMETIVNKGGAAGETAVKRAKEKEIPLYYVDSVTVPLSQAEKGNVRIAANIKNVMDAPVESGDYAGTAKIYCGNELLAETEIRAGQTVPRHDLKTSAEKVLKEFTQIGTKNNVKVTLPEF